MFRCAIEIQDPGSYAAGVFDVGWGRIEYREEVPCGVSASPV